MCVLSVCMFTEWCGALLWVSDAPRLWPGQTSPCLAVLMERRIHWTTTKSTSWRIGFGKGMERQRSSEVTKGSECRSPEFSVLSHVFFSGQRSAKDWLVSWRGFITSEWGKWSRMVAVQLLVMHLAATNRERFKEDVACNFRFLLPCMVSFLGVLLFWYTS
jgi:hypothetical protein